MFRDRSDRSSPDNLATARATIKRLESERAAYRDRAEAADREARCFRELAEHIREVFWMTNALGDRLIYISPAYEHIWGESCNSLYIDPGRRLAWVHEDDRERVLTAFKRDAAHGDYDQTYRIRRPDGRIRWIRDRAFPVCSHQGEVYRLAGLAIDLTEDIANRDRRAELQDLMAMRERVSVFASLGAGLAHDLGQPLTSARNFIAQARLESNPGDGPLARADAQLDRAGAIIRHLRDFAREGRPTIRPEALACVLGEVRDLLEPMLRCEDIIYHFPETAELEGVVLPLDRVFTQQILRNLIANAVEALRDQPDRRLDVEVDLHTPAHIDIRVSDTGRGIAADVDPFAPFVTTRTDGLGLGLCVSRSLARSHDGDLFIDRRRRRTCLVLRLPRSTGTA